MTDATLSMEGKSELVMQVQAATVMARGLMQDAAMYARRVHRVEQQGTYWDVVRTSEEDISWHRACALSGIVMAASAAEAFANEAFLAPEVQQREGQPYTAAARAGTVQDWKAIARQPVLRNPSAPSTELGKLDEALKRAGKAQLMDRSSTVYQECYKALELRNGIVHFKTATYPPRSGDPHAALEQLLQSSSFLATPYYPKEGMSPFPHHCVSHACLKWAIESHIALLDEFAGRLGITAFTAHGWNFRTE